ncbi:MAG: ZIP family metal transporter [Sphingomonadaceae bacterium]
MDLILPGLAGSAAAGSMTLVGALPVLFGRGMSARQEDALLGFAAGVMLAASIFSLLLPAIDSASAMFESRFAPAGIAALGVLLGGGAMVAANALIPHRHFVQGDQGPVKAKMDKIRLFVAAITIHNFPEGLAMGVGFAGGDIEKAVVLSAGIGIQNLPEGLAVALALRANGVSRWKSFFIAAATGILEPVGGLIGVSVVSLVQPILPWALAFAAGTMLHIVSHEIIPETHSRGFQRQATTGMATGFVLMMFLDVSFGG